MLHSNQPVVMRVSGKTAQVNTGDPKRAKVSFSDRVKAELLLLQVRSSQLRLSQTSHQGGVTGMSNREETLWRTYNALERLNLSAGLRMPWDPPFPSSWRSWWKRLGSGIHGPQPIRNYSPHWGCCLHEPDRDKQLQEKDEDEEENTVTRADTEWQRCPVRHEQTNFSLPLLSVSIPSHLSPILAEDHIRWHTSPWHS